MTTPCVAVHKFSSCDGCQLAFINAGEDLLTLTQRVDIIHFAEAGPVDSEARVDIAFVEGSISTPEEEQRIQQIRKNSDYLVTIGACATSGGLQALRNMHNTESWVEGIYASPAYISTLDKVSPIADHVKVDFELWGCPITGRQLFACVSALLHGVTPKDETEKVCMECKRQQNVCVMVTQQAPCLGPVTKNGCGAICPEFGRACYACFGPSENTNTDSLVNRFQGFGLSNDDIVRRFRFINNNAPENLEAIEKLGIEQE